MQNHSFARPALIEEHPRGSKELIDAIAKDVPYLVDAEVHSVEQVIMAINTLVNAMACDNPVLAQGPISKAIDNLYDDVKDREHFDREHFARHVAELQRQIR